MTEQKQKTYTDFVLPAGLVTKLDLSRLVSDMEQLDTELTTVSVRSKVEAKSTPEPVIPELLEEFLQLNGLALESSAERSYLIRQLRLLKDRAPVVHLTFATAADHDSLHQLVQWLRQATHPQTVVSAGLQPSLVAGVSIRTANKVHDLSLRKALTGQHDKLVRQLEALGADS